MDKRKQRGRKKGQRGFVAAWLLFNPGSTIGSDRRWWCKSKRRGKDPVYDGGRTVGPRRLGKIKKEWRLGNFIFLFYKKLYIDIFVVHHAAVM